MLMDLRCMGPCINASESDKTEEINLTLAAGQLSAATSAQIKAVVDGISADTPAGLNNRVYMALLLTLASPEYLVQT
jgi:hypothetical protein